MAAWTVSASAFGLTFAGFNDCGIRGGKRLGDRFTGRFFGIEAVVENFGNDIDRQTAGDFAALLAPHAVGNNEQLSP